MTDFNYKKYSLEKLEEWVHDALDCDDVTSQDIYETITNAVDGNIEYHKKYLTKNIEVLSLLEGHRQSFEIDTSLDDCMLECVHSDMEALKYTEEEMNAMCDAAEDKEKCREYNLREAEYYNKRAELDIISEQVKLSGGYEWTSSQQDNIFNNVFNSQREDKVTKWQLPVEMDDPSGQYFVTFPDDLLEAANLKEGDQVEWIDQGDGSYLLKKV